MILLCECGKELCDCHYYHADRLGFQPPSPHHNDGSARTLECDPRPGCLDFQTTPDYAMRAAESLHIFLRHLLAPQELPTSAEAIAVFIRSHISTEISKLRAENERLKKALLPFAEAGALMTGEANYGDACPISPDPTMSHGVSPTVGDLRHALEIMTKTR